MNLQCTINGRNITADVAPDEILLNFLRSQGCYSVKCGCETANCGLCTVWLEGKPVLSCTVLAMRIQGKSVTTLEGVRDEAEEFGSFLAGEGAEQCGFCSPGFIMNVLAMGRDLDHPTDTEIREYLAGNLCRCTGYAGQMRAIKRWLTARSEKESKTYEER